MTRKRDCAPAESTAGARGDSEATADTPKRRGGRGEAQGMRVDRNPCQPPPAWAPSTGSDAAAMLAAHWPAPRNPGKGSP